MTKTAEMKMVSIAQKSIKEFIKQWEENPYLWETEADIHSELYNKIKSALHNKGIKPKSIKGYWWWEDGERKELPTRERFDWVYCKPKTNVKGKNEYYYPDIVIYKDRENVRPNKKIENDPILWACEIKYATEWSSDITDKSIEKDGNKLMKLLRQKSDSGGTDYACLLVFFRWKKLYKSKAQYERGKKGIYVRVNKIKALLKNFKTTGINTKFRCIIG